MESDTRPHVPRLAVSRKTGDEPLHAAGQPLPATVRDFWAWAFSDLASNAVRGVLAEYLVALALGVADGTRIAWDAADLISPAGTRIEVKSAAYLQSWAQPRPSTITFGIRPTQGWDAATNTTGSERRRQAAIYVFALLSHTDKATLDVLNVDQWRLLVLATAVLDAALPTQKTISLARLRRLGAREVGYAELAATIAALEV